MIMRAMDVQGAPGAPSVLGGGSLPTVVGELGGLTVTTPNAAGTVGLNLAAGPWRIRGIAPLLPQTIGLGIGIRET